MHDDDLSESSSHGTRMITIYRFIEPLHTQDTNGIDRR
jgi:hypothetical protein